MEESASGKWESDSKKYLASRNTAAARESNQLNPILVAFEQELSRFIKYIKRKSETVVRSKKNDEEPIARGSNTLFSMWNSYEARLPPTYYQEKLLGTGDFLFSVKEYKLAQFHCYGRYLTKNVKRGVTLEQVADLDAEAFF